MKVNTGWYPAKRWGKHHATDFDGSCVVEPLCLGAFGVSFTTCLPDPATPAPWHPATGLGVCASCLSCLLVLISPFYEHRPYRTATAETRVLEDKTLIGAMVEIDANVEAFHVIDGARLGLPSRRGRKSRM